jgi:hypothetical protein
MRTSPRSRFWVVLGILALGASILPACSSGGGGSSGVPRVVEFVGAGTDGAVFRNQPLEFVFSTDIDPTSVSVIGFQLRSNDQLVPGRIEVQGKRILWTAVVLPEDRNDYNPPNYPPINGLGLDGATRYTVQILGGSPYSLKSTKGRPLANSFQASFTTSTEFLPEDNPIPPRIDSIDFDPDPVVDGDPFSPNPADWPLVDPSDVAMLIQFSERINPDTVEPFRTVTVTNITDIPDPPPGVGSPALVSAELAPTADELDLVPLVSLGDLPGSIEPYVFEVRLTEQITDLAGNPLEGDVVFHFKTIDKAGEPNYLVITEDFDTAEFRDDNDTNAIWDNGSLEGKDVDRRVTTFVPTPQSNFNLAHPLVEVGNALTPFGCRFQMKFTRNNVGANPGDSIIGMSWSPRSNFLFFSNYSRVTVKLGHFAGSSGGNLDFEFERNYDRDYPVNPVTVFTGDYSVPYSLSTVWQPWPEFSKDFEYDTNKELVFEYDMPEGGDTFQLFKNKSTSSIPRNRLFGNGGTARGINGRENTQYNHQFTLVSKSSFGVSKAYGVPDTFTAPLYGAYLLVKDGLRSGTQVFVEWAPGIPGQEIDQANDYFEDITQVSGSPAAGFRASLTANPFTGVVPRVLSISFAVADADDIEE